MQTKYLRSLWRALVVVASLGLAPIHNVGATLVTGVLAGELDHIGGNFDPVTQTFDGFGLGLESGDSVLGSFTYDATSGMPLSFSANVGGLSFTATNLTLGANPFDGLLSWFYIVGELENGLFMSIGLTNGDGEPVFSGPFPSVLRPEDWFLAAFNIGADATPPIESSCCRLESIYATSTRNRGDFVIFSVPEPGTIALFGLGLAGLVVVRRRRVA